MPIPESGGPRRPSIRLLLPARAWLIIGAAFATGLLLSAILWLGRGDAESDALHSDPSRSTAGPARSLPAPQPADAAGASGMAEVDPEAVSRSREDVPSAAPPALTPDQPPPAAMAGGATRPPVAVSTPAPRYPSSALRGGESGQVMLRVIVGTGGRVTSVDVVDSSNSRALDRAAVGAVTRWRFQPALRDGQPVEGVVQVPIDFSPSR